MLTVNAMKCLICGDIVYSRARHDFRSCSCGNIYVDRGLDYFRYGYVDATRTETQPLALPMTESELYEDWNRNINKFGLIKGDLEMVKTTAVKSVVKKVTTAKKAPAKVVEDDFAIRHKDYWRITYLGIRFLGAIVASPLFVVGLVIHAVRIGVRNLKWIFTGK